MHAHTLLFNVLHCVLKKATRFRVCFSFGCLTLRFVIEFIFRLASRKFLLVEVSSTLHSNTYPSLIHFSVFCRAFWVRVDVQCDFLDFANKNYFQKIMGVESREGAKPDTHTHRHTHT